MNRNAECFYVSVLDQYGNDGSSRLGLLAGPFSTHEEALALVDKARDVACRVDGRAHWYAVGTVKMKDGLRDGVLNKLLGLEGALE